jgi:predicted amidophosphoribosyltransferase
VFRGRKGSSRGDWHAEAFSTASTALQLVRSPAPILVAHSRDVGTSWAAVAELFLGASCAGCAGPGPPLCPACRAALAGIPRSTTPTPCPLGFPRTWTAGHYDGVVRSVVLAHKERGQLALARPLGDVLARVIENAAQVLEDDPYGSRVLIPVPSTRRRVRDRGHDPLMRITRVAAGRSRRRGRDTAVLPILRQRRHVADQAELDSAGRRANLAGSLWVPDRLRRLVRDRPVVLVDDVVTTGATLTEGARALYEAGAADVVAATIAATARRTCSLITPGAGLS